jgi:diadenosine tetraphosphatase ApaH/serine/threonine PP2A family protein phosphatase
MRVLVVSDIHANLTALEAVLDAARPFQALWCLGDTVGYGPDPNECVELVRSFSNLTCLIGNHDQAALGVIPLARFNSDAQHSAVWTRKNLNSENVAYLESLPSRLVMDPFTLAHGSPRQPIWEYILDHESAARNLDDLRTEYCLVGHSHLPLIFHRDSNDGPVTPTIVKWGQAMQLVPQMILNPGSVGQPRDLDPRAAYAILDTDELTWEARRVEYDIAQVQERIMKAGLPPRLAQRLVAGW